MYYGITTKATDFTEEGMKDWRARALDAIFFFVPRANPDHERLYPQVRFWALEMDEEGWPQREVGLDASRQALFCAPDKRNTGFWPDMARMQFAKSDVETISEDTFEALWAGAGGGDDRSWPKADMLPLSTQSI
jgi:hypothetical protein